MPHIVLIIIIVFVFVAFIVYSLDTFPAGRMDTDDLCAKYNVFILFIMAILVNWSIAYGCCELQYDYISKVRVHWTDCKTKQYCIYKNEMIDLTKHFGSI